MAPPFRLPTMGREFLPRNVATSSSAFIGSSAAAETPGNGLGLSLVAAVARLHGADIEMLDNAPGLKFQLRFPRPTGS